MEPQSKLDEWEELEKQNRFNSPLVGNDNFCGPVDNRQCTDWKWVGIFFLANLALLGLASYTYTFGDPNRLIHGWDFRAELCGEGGLSFKPYTYFLTPLQSLDITVCMEGCPVQEAMNAVCFYSQDHKTDISGLGCYNAYIAKPYFNRYCLPASDLYRTQVINWLYDPVQATTRVVGDFYRAWDVLAIAGVVTGVLAFAYLLWLKLGQFIIILGVLSAFALVFGLSILCFLIYEESDRIDDRMCTEFNSVDMANCDPGDITTGYRVLCFCVIGIAVMVTVAIIVNIGKLVPGAELLSLVSQPLRNTVWLLVCLCGIVFLGVAVFTLCISLVTYTASCGDIENVSAPAVPGGVVNRLHFGEVERGFILFELMMIFWWMSALVHILEYITGFFTVSWFFSKDKARMMNPVRMAVWTLCRYHAGSVLLASIAIPLLRTPRQVMRLLKDVVRTLGSESSRCCTSCFGVCFESYEVLLKFLNSHALPYQALWGHSFCESAKRGYYLTTRSPPYTLTAVHAAELHLWMYQLVLILSAPVFVYYWITHTSTTFAGEATKQITSVAGVAGAAFILSWFLAEAVGGFVRGLMYGEVVAYLADKEMFAGVQRYADISFAAAFREEMPRTLVGKLVLEKPIVTEASQQDLFDPMQYLTSGRLQSKRDLASISSQPSLLSDTYEDDKSYLARPTSPEPLILRGDTKLTSGSDTARNLSGPAQDSKKNSRRQVVQEEHTPDDSLSSFNDSESEDTIQAPVARPPSPGGISNRRRPEKKGGMRRGQL